jgi:hypothetical protein
MIVATIRSGQPVEVPNTPAAAAKTARLPIAIRELYDYRSRLLHGQKNIPNRWAPDDGTSFDERAYQIEVTAMAVLVATLQYLAGRNLDDIVFEYKIG